MAGLPWWVIVINVLPECESAMSLVTTCPHCHTTFKIAKDQLKLKAGLVRCGICQKVFNGAAHLIEDTVEVSKEISQDGIQSPSTSEIDVGHVSSDDEKGRKLPSPASGRRARDEGARHRGARVWQRSSKFHDPFRGPPSPRPSPQWGEGGPREGDPPHGDAGEETIVLSSNQVDTEVDLTALNNLVRPSQSTDAPADPRHDIQTLSFIRQAHTKKRVTWLSFIGILVLLLLLVGQATYHFRNLIAAAYPPSKNMLVALCGYVHCQIQLPTQLDALSFEADKLHTLAREHTFEFSLLLRNQSALVQAWPHIELTLKNAQKQTVLRRVFSPTDYLRNPGDVVNGFPAHQEHAVELYFEMAQVAASDYAVAIFYP